MKNPPLPLLWVPPLALHLSKFLPEFLASEKDSGAPNRRWYCYRLDPHVNYLIPGGYASA